MQGSFFVARISLSPLIPTCTMESPSSCLSALSRSSSSLLCGGCDLSAQIILRHILLVILLAPGGSQLSLSSPSSFPLSFTLSFSPMWFFTSLPLIPHHPISTKFRFREILPRHLRVSISLLILCRDPEDIIASAPPIISLCFFSLPFPSHPIPASTPLISLPLPLPPSPRGSAKKKLT